ncbi:MAG TPA: methyltransferase [Anaerolineaceae bacterium]|jgi:putative Mg2+ transporter-C (MgtC) family protein|nr:methyltransferase [Anaerolineaceae bacterium]
MIPTGEMILRLAVSVLLGAAVGYERERDKQPAGLRTHMILVLGACLAMILSINIGAEHGSDPARLAAQVIAGIGFLGAGAILRMGFNVKGLTTAATLWTMAVVGMAVGYGYYLISVVATALMLIILVVVNIIEHRYIRTTILRRITIEGRGGPGQIHNIRKVINHLAENVINFSVQRNIKGDRVRVQVMAEVDRGEKMENLVETLSNIEGVRSIKID